MSVVVTVPATSANLGSGFDTIGLALAWRNAFWFLEPGETPPDLARLLPSDSLVHRSMARLCQQVGARLSDSLAVYTVAPIPTARGLGSSSTAVVGGLLGANGLLGTPLDREVLLTLALEIEGHPDNVAPALFGGIQIVASGVRIAIAPPADLTAVVCIPDRLLATDDARAALPAAWPRASTVENLGRVSVLTAAFLQRRWDWLRVGMGDALHQPYRAPLLPGFTAAVAAALDAGAWGACLSGSGSTILALTTGQEAAIGCAMVRAIERSGDRAEWHALALDPTGAVAEHC
jgi:homoserine kinase